jgi:hypothetical protein
MFEHLVRLGHDAFEKYGRRRPVPKVAVATVKAGLPSRSRISGNLLPRNSELARSDTWSWTTAERTEYIPRY